MKTTQKVGGKHPKGEKGGKHKKKDDKEEEESYADLTFCFQADIILRDLLKKADYIGTYTVSNSKSAMSKMIGIQIDNKLKMQGELEKIFNELILEKAQKIPLIEEDEINRLNKEIEDKAHELKESTNDICKTLSENPDIPKNLLKAKRDQKLLITDLKKFFDDFLVGKWNNYDQVIDSYIKQKIDVAKLREKEMGLFRELKVLNEHLSKEEADYNKDQIEMNQSLLRMKKLLAKTKLEENIFIDYEKNHIEALAALTESNFREEEEKMKREIAEKETETLKISKLNDFVFAYYSDQKKYYDEQLKSWAAEKGRKEGIAEDKKKQLDDRNNKKKTTIEKLKKDIINYRAANDHLMEVAKDLSYDNFATIHGANVPLPAIPEQKIPEQKEVGQDKHGGDS